MELVPAQAELRRARSLGALRSAAVRTSALAIGAVVAVSVESWNSRSVSPSVGPRAWWVADRDANELVALDDDAFVMARVALDHPVRVATCPSGAVWALCAIDGHPRGRHRLIAMDPSGAELSRFDVDEVVDSCTSAEDWIALERENWGEHERKIEIVVRRRSVRGEVVELARLPSASAVAATSSVVIVGDANGNLFEFASRSSGAPVRTGVGGDAVASLAPGPSGGWWLLNGGDHPALALLDAELTTRWRTASTVRAAHVAPVGDTERAWLVDRFDSRAVRIGRGGSIELDRPALPLIGLDRGVATDDGGCWFAAPGAALRVDARGELLPGQGGFAFAVDLARVDLARVGR